MLTLLFLDMALLRRRDAGGDGSGLGCFVLLAVVGIVVFLILRGRRDREEQLGTAHRPMGSGPVEGLSFACPFAKCPGCGAAGDKMKHQYDGLRKVTWTCGYCGSIAGVQELKDEELPAEARQRLGLDAPAGLAPGQPGYYPPQGGTGMGGLLTGMMIGEMLGGGHHRQDGDWGSGGDSGGSDWGDSGGDSGGSDWGDSGGDSGGGDWGDSGGGDSGGSDF